MAQSAATGTVSGLVTDPQAAAISGGVVKLIDSATNIPRSTLTNDAGRYDFPNVSPGAQHYGGEFRICALAWLAKVEVGLSVTLDFKLQVGATSTT